MAGLLASRPGAAGVLVRHGMHCIGCAIGRFETVAEACAIYGVSAEQLLLEIDRQAHAAASTVHEGAPGDRSTR